MKILILVTGSISAYKMVDIANSFRHRGHEVKIALTKAALQFIPKLTFTGQRFECYTDEDEWSGVENGVLHINLAKWADTVLLAPATSNTIGKFVNGITDNLVMSILRAFKGTIFIAPAMNTQMYFNSEAFLKKLKDFNTYIIPPQEKLLACGDYGVGGLASKDTIIDLMLTHVFPLRLQYVGSTDDSMSFQKIDISKQVELPLETHCGGFGFKRKYHIHEGVDLYTNEGESVFACDAGVVVACGFFTGEMAGSKHWNETQYVAVKSNGIINLYGEITFENISPGDEIKKGQFLGRVKRVLLKDKGRPMSMLHFEQHVNTDSVEWDSSYLNNPTNNINPTDYLKNSLK